MLSNVICQLTFPLSKMSNQITSLKKKVQFKFTVCDLIFFNLLEESDVNMEDNEDTFSFDISSTYEESEPLSVGLMNAFDNILNTVLKVAEKFEGLLKMASEAVVTLTSLKLPGNSGSATKSSKSDNQNATKNDLWGVEVPTVNGLTEVAGLGSIKKELYALVVLRRHHPQLFRNRMSCNSILLYGPPGTGKTRLVHGLVAESGAVFYNISAGSLLGPYVGQTEQ